MPKKLLIVKASHDICATEVDHIKTIADMYGMQHETYELTTLANFEAAVTGRGKYDYIYLAGHADITGFGERDASNLVEWEHFGTTLCSANCLHSGSILLLACCRGGISNVAVRLFLSCTQIDYVCGPRWTVTGLDITTGFHVFIYNMEIRHEQPSCAVERASKATGYDFFCHDRVETEDAYFAQTIIRAHRDANPHP